MKLEDLMTTDVITVGVDTSLKEAARRMIEAGVSGLLVTGTRGELLGIISEGDFVANESHRREGTRPRILKWFLDDEEIPTFERTVEDIMTAEVLTLPPDADHTEAARLMQKAGIKRIPVIAEGGKLLGLVARSDILRAFARPDSEIADEITEHVMRKVLWLDPRKVTIRVDDGNVSMAGRLETKSDAHLLVEMTKRLDGVVSVSDSLTWEVDNSKVTMVPPPLGPNW